MDKVEIKELTPGKFFSKPLYLDKNFILLSPDIPVSNELIERLKKWDFLELYCEGEQSNENNTMKEALKEAVSSRVNSNNKMGNDDLANEKSDEPQEPTQVNQTTSPPQQKEETPTPQVTTHKFVTDTTNDELHRKSLEYYIKTLQFFSKIYRQFAQVGKLDESVIAQKVKEMLFYLQQDKNTFLHLPTVKTNNYLIVDSVKSAFLALALAEVLKFPPHRQLELGIAAILHDIGMLLIPSSLYLHDRQLTNEELAKIKEHVNLGAKAAKAANFSKDIVQAIQEHHENYNGSGYPFKMGGVSISTYGRALGILSGYIASSSDRLFKAKRNAHDSIMDILSKCGNIYDPTIGKLFVLMLGIYPIGSFVMLENNQIGVVLSNSIEDPKAPKIKLLVDENNNLFSQFDVIQCDPATCPISKILTSSEIESVKQLFIDKGIINSYSNLFDNL